MLALATTPDHRRKVRLADYEFPTDVHRGQFLEAIHKHPESTIRTYDGGASHAIAALFGQCVAVLIEHVYSALGGTVARASN